MNNNLQTDNTYLIEVEKIIITSVLNNDKNCDEIFLHLNPSDFYLVENRIIFKIATAFRENNQKVSVFSVLDHIKNTEDKLDFNAYEKYIVSIASLYTYQQNIPQLIEIVKNASIKRKINEFSLTLQSTDLDLINAQEKLWELEKEFADIAGSKKSQEIEVISKILDDFNHKLDIIRNQTETFNGIKSGYDNLDYLTNGFTNGDLIILASRPGIGKTTLAINFLINAAKIIKLESEQKSEQNIVEENQNVVLMFSIEMGKDQICHRMLSATSRVNPIKKDLTNNEKSSLLMAVSFLKTLPIYIDDSSDLTLIDIQSKIKQISNSKQIKLIVIDYLQLLKLNQRNLGSLNRQQEVAEISRSLKKMARQFNVPIIAIAQLSRKIEERKGGPNARPMLSDLRESGAIEQDADLVCFLMQHIDKNEELDESEMVKKNNLADIEFVLSKNRNGMTGSCHFIFDKEHSVYIEKEI